MGHHRRTLSERESTCVVAPYTVLRDRIVLRLVDLLPAQTAPHHTGHTGRVCDEHRPRSGWRGEYLDEMAVRAEPNGGLCLVVILFEHFDNAGSLATISGLAAGHPRAERKAQGNQGRKQTGLDD